VLWLGSPWGEPYGRFVLSKEDESSVIVVGSRWVLAHAASKVEWDISIGIPFHFVQRPLRVLWRGDRNMASTGT